MLAKVRTSSNADDSETDTDNGVDGVEETESDDASVGLNATDDLESGMSNVGSEISKSGIVNPTIAMCTHRGKIKRVDLARFANIRSSGLIAMSLAEGDELSYVRLTHGNGEVMIVTAQGQALRFSERLVRQMGRTASGVRAMRLKKQGDYIAGMEVIEPNGFLLTVTEKGFGKCTELDEYNAKGRGGSGMRTMTSALDVTGELVAARVVQASDQITIITADGTALRQRVNDIPKTGRATKGSRLINLRDGDSVASVARLQEIAETIVAKPE
jgi:DNA gyrase subunit A